MTGNANPGRVDVVPRREQVPGRGEIGDHPVVLAFLALDLDTGVFRPPVKDERRRDSVAGGGGEAACRDKGELVILDARMADGDVLRQHQSGVPRWRRGTVWHEEEHLHRTVLHVNGDCGFHQDSLRLARRARWRTRR